MSEDKSASFAKILFKVSVEIKFVVKGLLLLLKKLSKAFTTGELMTGLLMIFLGGCSVVIYATHPAARKVIPESGYLFSSSTIRNIMSALDSPELTDSFNELTKNV